MRKEVVRFAWALVAFVLIVAMLHLAILSSHSSSNVTGYVVSVRNASVQFSLLALTVIILISFILFIQRHKISQGSYPRHVKLHNLAPKIARIDYD